MSLKVTQIATLVAAAAITLSANAASTFGSHGAVTSGTASDGMTVSGTITRVATPQWERANASSGVTASAATTDNMDADKKELTVSIPGDGSTTGGHTALSVRTAGGFKEMGLGSGVQVDIMNGTNPATISGRVGGGGGSSLTDGVATVPLKVGGSTVGEAQVPIRYGALYQYGSDGSSSQRVRTCTGGGTLISGNLLPAIASEAGSSAPTTRTLLADAGLRSTADAVAAVKATPGSSNAAGPSSTPISDSSGTCNKPTTAQSSHLVDHVVFVRSTDMVLKFNTAVTATTNYSIPLSFRVTHI